MKQRIWKYQLEVVDDQEIVAPVGAQPLSVQMQGGTPCLWMLVNAEATKMAHHIRILGTGHPVPEDTRGFIGTFQLYGGELIFHCFYLGEVS